MDKLGQLEAQRAKYRRFELMYTVFAVVFYIVTLAYTHILAQKFFPDRVFAGILLVGIMIIFFNALFLNCVWKFMIGKKQNELNHEFRMGVIAPELNAAFSDVNYIPDTSLSRDYAHKLGIFKYFKKLQGSGYLEAKYRERLFRRSDILISTVEKNPYDGQRYGNVDVFQGSVTELELTAAFSGRLCLIAYGMDHTVAEAEQTAESKHKGESKHEVIKEWDLFGSSVAAQLQLLGGLKDKYRLDWQGAGSEENAMTPNRVERLEKLDAIIPSPFALLVEEGRLVLVVSRESALDIDLGLNAAPIAEQRKRIAAEVKILTNRLDILLEMGVGQKHAENI